MIKILQINYYINHKNLNKNLKLVIFYLEIIFLFFIKFYLINNE